MFWGTVTNKININTKYYEHKTLFPCSLEVVTLCRLAAILSPSNYLYRFYLYNQKLKNANQKLKKII